MAKITNPFTPNFGQVPSHIAGRTQIISEILRSLDGDGGDPAQTSLLIGARGTGKTALLTFFSAEAQSRGWITVSTNCIEGMQEDILQQTKIAAREFLPAENSRRIKGVTIGNILSLEIENSDFESGNWRTRMAAVLDVLSKYDVGLLITIDEISPRVSEMIQIASIYQLWLREGRKISLLMAGLPSEILSIVNDKHVSFLRRASQYSLGSISDYEIEDAFLRTVEDSGKRITSEALKQAVDTIGGFPYMMQLVGYRAWEGADMEIGAEAMQRGIDLANRDFEHRVLLATIQELSDGDRTFLKAMIEDGDVSRVADIQARMGKSSGFVSRYRARLIARGVIEAKGRGKVAFSLPHLKDYLEENFTMLD